MELIKNYKEGKLSTGDIRRLNNTVICLMILIAATSIAWTVTIHVLHNSFLGARFTFHERDFSRMDNKTKLLYSQYIEEYLGAEFKNKFESASNIQALRQTSDDLESQTTTRPKKRKLAHLFQVSSLADEEPYQISTEPTDLDDEEHSTPDPRLDYDFEADRLFLSTMVIDHNQVEWRQSAAIEFIYCFSFLSEIIAIIWACMCLVFQSGVKRYWGLPKPWRIVVPSILMFAVMAVGCLVYTILANQFVKEFCQNLKDNLTNPSAISCGNAFTLLRPAIKEHVLYQSFYLGLFKASYILTLFLWILALVVMVFRYIFAVDFQVIEIEPPKNKDEFIEVPLNSPKRQPLHLLSVNDFAKSEDDFQSAKTHLSEAVTPLLEPKTLLQKP